MWKTTAIGTERGSFRPRPTARTSPLASPMLLCDADNSVRLEDLDESCIGSVAVSRDR